MPNRPATSKKRATSSPLNRRWHLARDQHEIELTEFEYAALRWNAAFERWNEAAIRAAGGTTLTFTEAAVLHVIRMQERPKGVSTIATLLNRDDISNLQYAIRKLRVHGFIRPTAAGSRKNYEYEVTPLGRMVTERVADIASAFLFSSTRALAEVEPRLRAAAELLRIMTGILDEAARVATTFTPVRLTPRRGRRRPSRPA